MDTLEQLDTAAVDVDRVGDIPFLCRRSTGVAHVHVQVAGGRPGLAYAAVRVVVDYLVRRASTRAEAAVAVADRHAGSAEAVQEPKVRVVRTALADVQGVGGPILLQAAAGTVVEYLEDGDSCGGCRCPLRSRHRRCAQR